MKHEFHVVVETDDTHLDAPDWQSIANEIQNNLEWDGHKTGIITTDVEHYVSPIPPANEEGGD